MADPKGNDLQMADVSECLFSTVLMTWGLLAFVAELALVAGAGYAAYLLAHRTWGTVAGWAAAVATALIVIVIWSLWFAPKSPRRLPLLPRILLAYAMVAAAAIAVFVLGQPVPAIVLLALGTLGILVAQPVMERYARPRADVSALR